MKKIILAIFIGFTLQISYAQAEFKDSFEKGVEYIKTQNYKKAVKTFSDILKKANDEKLKKFCYIYRAFAYNGLGEYKYAISDLDKAIELDSTDLASYIDRGIAKVYSNDYTGAKSDFELVLSKDSISEQGQAALYYLAKIAYQQGQFEQSIKYYNKLIVLIPNDPELYFNRGAAKGMIMDIEGSIKDYDKAIELKPDYMEAYANRGIQKINAILTKNKIDRKDCIEDPCKDLLKAQQMGDKSVEDMIFLYCKNCK